LGSLQAPAGAERTLCIFFSEKQALSTIEKKNYLQVKKELERHLEGSRKKF